MTRMAARTCVESVRCLPCRCEQPSVSAQRQKTIQPDQRFGRCEQTGPKFTEHTGIQARVIEFQRQGVFPGQVTPHGVSCLTVSQVFGVLHHTDQHQSPRGSRRLPPLGIQVDEILIGQENAEFVAQPQRNGAPLGNAARAMRAVSAGTSGIAVGRNISHYALCPGNSPAESERLSNDLSVASQCMLLLCKNLLPNKGEWQ